jgi:hypothetical protein
LVPPSLSRHRRTLANDDLRTQKLKRRVKRLALDHTQKYFHTPLALTGKIMVNGGQGRLEISLLWKVIVIVHGNLLGHPHTLGKQDPKDAQ